ncbi:MAG: antibiotic biosynthesis monooxygenase [Bacteroidia bacterium]
MYCLIYQFEVKAEKTKEFETAWAGLTKLIYEFEGSLGSRLHLDENGKYIAYAQWPSKEVFDNAGNKLPAEADSFRIAIREACIEIKTLHKVERSIDLLENLTFAQK